MIHIVDYGMGNLRSVQKAFERLGARAVITDSPAELAEAPAMVLPGVGRDARYVAEHLVDHPAVSRVHYPGLPDHPNHDVARAQMRDFGGMVSVQLAGGRAAADRVATATELFFLAESLGGVESLVEHPGVMTHASVAGTQLEVPDDLLRLSVGIEHVDDLVADLDAALARAHG